MAVHSQEPIPSSKPLPEFLKNESLILESIALHRNGKSGTQLKAGESIIILDRFFAWGGTWDQAVLFRQNNQTSLLSYAYDSSERTLSSQIAALLKRSPTLDPMAASLKVRYNFQRLGNLRLPPVLANQLAMEIGSFQKTPQIKRGALDAHLVLIRVRTSNRSWWAMRDETQTSAGYQWVEGVLNFAKRSSPK